jgi:hypothetical protein
VPRANVLIRRRVWCVIRPGGISYQPSYLRAAGDGELVLGVLDPLLELPAIGVGLAALDEVELTLGGLELLPGACIVDLACRDRVVDECDRAVLLDLEETAAPVAYSRTSPLARSRYTRVDPAFNVAISGA